MAAAGRAAISVADVEKLTFGEALQQIEIHQIPITDKDITVEKAKLMIKDFISRNGGKIKQSAPWADQDTTTAALKDDLQNRDRMRELYGRAETYLTGLPKPFKDDLAGLFPNYNTQLATSSEDLKTSQCVLLVAGEMGSGKSSLVNLLLGRDILPTSDLRCTAAIVEIQYGSKPLAVIHWQDDSSGKSAAPFKLECDSEANFLKQLEQHIVKRNDDTDESPYEKIQLQWPLDMLKGGVVIVDSPGVGGSRSLPQHLSDYMERAFGFIYVIDSTTSIHKHRLGQLMAKAVDCNDIFDPTTTLFVCNRWDQVPSEDFVKVKTTLADKLSMILPNINQSQMYPISVLQSQQEITYGLVSPHHKQLVEGIRKLLPQSMKGKLRFYYRYLSTLLKRSLYSLRMSHNMHKQRVNNIKKDYSNIEGRMQRLQQDAKSKLVEMRTKVKMITMEAGFNAVKHLDSMRTRIRLIAWSEAECPQRERWQNVLKNANLAIADRIAQELNRWEQDGDLVKKMHNDIVKLFQEQFELLDTEMDKIKNLLLQVNEIDDDDMRAVRNFTQSVRKNIDPKKQTKLQSQQMKGQDNFLSLGATVISRFNLDVKNSELKSLFKDKYSSDPCKVMAHATEIYIGYFTDAEVVSALAKYFDRFVKGIDRVGAFMPEMMEADRKLLKNMEQELEFDEQRLEALPGISRKCVVIQGSLDMFHVQRLMVMDFTADQLQYKESDKIDKGSFATVYRAVLKKRSGDINVAVKVPLDTLRIEDVTDVLLEETMLRELDNENFVKYFGVCRKGPDHMIKLTMVMEYCPYTLKDRRIDTVNSPSSLGRNPQAQIGAIEIITNYLVQICMGLKFLHNKSIVHRDLKPANILLTKDSKVRIADLGLAKRVKEIATLGIGTPVYMAPEILCHFMKYDTKADIYSLAMIMWELWYGRDLANYASEEIQGGLKNEIERGWRPSLSKVHAPNKFWSELIVACWNQDPTQRPRAEQVYKKLVKLYKEIRSQRQAQSTTN